MLNLLKSVPSIAAIEANYNVGSLFDIPTGMYHKGVHGESILSSGVSSINSIAGPPNSFKSALILYNLLTIASQVRGTQAWIYDTEGSMKYPRIKQLAKRFPKLKDIDFGSEAIRGTEDDRFTVTSSKEMMGEKFFEMLKEIVDGRDKDRVKQTLTTPFLIPGKDEHLKALLPLNVIIDSLSNFEVSQLNAKMIDKNELGDSGNNMFFMKSGIVKKFLINQLPLLTNTGGICMWMTAHVGDEFDLDGPYAPKKHKMTHARKGSKVTGTTKAFEFINTVVWEIHNASLLNNSASRTGVLYPNGDLDRDENSKDLIKLRVVTMRSKLGGSGIQLDLIISQREGHLPALTQFHYCKESKDATDLKGAIGWGVEGSSQSYFMSLYPEAKLGRTTVRAKLDDDEKLRRAVHISSEILQMKSLWVGYDDDFFCEPSVLRDDLIAKGYDWDILLDTRSYWVFKEHEQFEDKPYLSTMDLLLMRTGEYHPYWYDDLIKKLGKDKPKEKGK